MRAAAAAMRSTPPRLPAPRPATTRNLAVSRSPVAGGSSSSMWRKGAAAEAASSSSPASVWTTCSAGASNAASAQL